ncbi:MAG: ferrous iron transport protein A [Thermoprotei archaeon]|nr:MAG: ferrous iron transport protein A [Thermoprotei archaeon]RLF19105.1 MAG: ferrous iron transport protein A [Thermoprotei archaeon]
MSGLIPLIMLNPGEEGEVVYIHGGWGILRRLAELGIYPGARVRMENKSWGPVVLWVSGVRIAIGRGMASRIYVRPLGPRRTL